ncbi:hypothetical protein C8A01DRAFT_15963 [Parachaetomium inaequale]|uniref:Uncharacterized protein n=1 Tax=Parachaetomium inaequale TaxID=2588326 RepID=A0AAN6SR90_9PEZI|nr:hypothetical protein C8A01DRAFT_15963 [Parachaetomium inaequale]
MDGTFPQFSRLPQEIQDDIWEKSVMNPTPCVQALGLYVLPSQSEFEDELRTNKELAQNTEAIKMMEQDSDKLRFLLPAPEMARRSPYYRTLVQVAPASVAANEAYVRVVQARARKELAELDALASKPSPHDAWEVDENQTAVTIFALLTRLREEDSKYTEVLPDLIMGSSGPHQIAPVFLNPAADILWLDCGAFRPRPHDMSRASHRLGEVLCATGVYNRYLVPLQRLAIEFSQPTFGKRCDHCEYLQRKGNEYQRWLDSWRKRSPDDYTVCLLCTALERPELADLSAAQRQEAKKWLKKSDARVHLELADLAKPSQEAIPSELSPDEANISSLYKQGFHKAYPILQRVYRAMQAIRKELGIHPWEDKPKDLAACVEDHDGNLADFYNDVILGSKQREWLYYDPQAYDDETGAPLCDAAVAERDRNYRTRHARQYPWYCEAVAAFWPLTTPNLKTLYAIDRGIKLRPGVVSIPPGATTFQGNGCVYVEVPARSPSRDGVWRYPRPGPFGGDVFTFARHLRQSMARRQTRFRRDGANHPDLEPMIAACTAQGVESPHNRAIRSGEVPEVKVLAIVE